MSRARAGNARRPDATGRRVRMQSGARAAACRYGRAAGRDASAGEKGHAPAFPRADARAVSRDGPISGHHANRPTCMRRESAFPAGGTFSSPTAARRMHILDGTACCPTLRRVRGRLAEGDGHGTGSMSCSIRTSAANQRIFFTFYDFVDGNQQQHLCRAGRLDQPNRP